MNKTLQYLFFVMLCVLGYLFYQPTFKSTVFIDSFLQNERISSTGLLQDDGLSFSKNILTPRWVIQSFNQSTITIFGVSVESIRLQNFILHLLICFLLFFTLNFILNFVPYDSWVSRRRHSIVLLSIALFLLHPVQVMTALNILQMRVEALYMLFFMLALICFLKVVSSEFRWFFNYWFYALLAASFFLVGTKESCIVAPILFLLIDYLFVARLSLQKLNERSYFYSFYVGFFFLLFFFVNSHLSIVTMITGQMTVLSSPGCLVSDYYHLPISAYTYFLTQMSALVHYLIIFVFPINLYADYQFTVITSVFNGSFISSVLILAGLLLVAFYLAKKEKSNLIYFGLGWFFLVLLPRISLVPSSELVADYKTFVPSIGIFILLATVFWYLVDWVIDVFLIDSQIGKMFFYTTITFLFMGVWHYSKGYARQFDDEVSFWKNVLLSTPTRARSFYFLGNAFIRNENIEDGLDAYHKSTMLDEGYSDPLIALGEYYQHHKDFHKAQHYYEKASRCECCDMSRLSANRAFLFSEMGQASEALEAFEQAAGFKTCSAQTFFRYAEILRKNNQFAQAYQVIKKALMLTKNPLDEMVLLEARLAFELGRHAEVVSVLEAVDPKNFDINVEFILAASYYSLENYKKAALFFERVYHKRPDNLDVAYNYAQALMQCGKYSSAIPYFQQCVEHSKYPFAQVNIAVCFQKNGNISASRNLLAQLEQKENLSVFVKNKLEMIKKDFVWV
jgi:tetratricopeptide (TPR) repeat protein